MQDKPTPRVIDLREYRHVRNRTEVARLARQLLASAYRIDLPPVDASRDETGEPYVAMFVEGPEGGFLTSPSLSDFEVRLAAWGVALRMVRRSGDPSVAWTASRLQYIAGLMGPHPEVVLGRAFAESDS